MSEMRRMRFTKKSRQNHERKLNGIKAKKEICGDNKFTT
jgi:hypothetical protein